MTWQQLDNVATAAKDFGDFASTLSSGSLAAQMAGFIEPFQAMATSLTGYASDRIHYLLVLHFVWTMGMSALSGRWVVKEAIQMLSGALVGLWFADNAVVIMNEILRFFMGAGEAIGGKGSGFANNPAQIVELGVQAATPYLDTVAMMLEYEMGALVLAPLMLLYLLAVVAIVIVYLALAGFVLFAQIEFYFAGAVFVLFAPLVVHPTTRPFVQQAAGRMVSKGIGFMFIIGLLGVAHKMLVPTNIVISADGSEVTTTMATVGDLVVTFGKMTLTCVVLLGANKMLSAAGGIGFGLSSIGMTGSMVPQGMKGAMKATKSAYNRGAEHAGKKANEAVRKARAKQAAKEKAAQDS